MQVKAVKRGASLHFLPFCAAACEGGSRDASGMLALRAAMTDLLASFTASFSAANAATCLRGGFTFGLPSGPSTGAGLGGPGRTAAAALSPPPLLLPASACSVLMCCCSCGAATMLPQCGQGSSKAIWVGGGCTESCGSSAGTQ